MNAFVFRLERLLDLRRKAERERAKALGDAVRAEETRRQDLENAELELDRAGEQATGAVGGVTTAGTLSNLRLAVRAAADRLEEVAESHREAEQGRDQEQERFGAARKDRRVVERLREKREETWKREVDRSEQSDIDEVARRRGGKA